MLQDDCYTNVLCRYTMLTVSMAFLFINYGKRPLQRRLDVAEVQIEYNYK